LGKAPLPETESVKGRNPRPQKKKFSFVQRSSFCRGGPIHVLRKLWLAKDTKRKGKKNAGIVKRKKKKMVARPKRESPWPHSVQGVLMHASWSQKGESTTEEKEAGEKKTPEKKSNLLSRKGKGGGVSP